MLTWNGYQAANHLRKIADKLEAVERGDIKRLMLFLPPRHGKSLLASQFFPAWYVGRNPEKQIIHATYGQDLADGFGRHIRNQITDPLYQAIFPGVTLEKDSQSVARFHTSNGCVYHAVGVGAAATGRGAHLLIIDDPVRNREDADSELMRQKTKDWYTSVAYTRLMPESAIIIIQTRWNSDDLSGWLLKEHTHEGWDVLNLPALDHEGNALWPESYPTKRLLQIRKAVGERDWAALYQQSPTVDGGNILKKQWWKIWPEGKKLPTCDHVFLSWDTAYSDSAYKSNSHSAMTAWGVFWNEVEDRHCLMLLKAWNGQIDYPELRKKAKELDKELEPDCHLIEKKASGQSLLQDMRRIPGVRVRSYNPDRDKVTRAYSVQAMLESGQVYAPDRRWAEAVIEHVGQFPNGAPPSSDYTDTVTQALIYLRNGYWLEHPDDKLPSPPIPVSDEDEDVKPKVARLYG
jgi:predicted phage terminase large subunit-like protein